MTKEELEILAELNAQYGTDIQPDDSIIFPTEEEIRIEMAYGETFDGASQNYERKAI